MTLVLETSAIPLIVGDGTHNPTSCLASIFSSIIALKVSAIPSIAEERTNRERSFPDRAPLAFAFCDVPMPNVKLGCVATLVDSGSGIHKPPRRCKYRGISAVANRLTD